MECSLASLSYVNICREIGGNPRIYFDPDAENRYLQLEHLGEVLSDLSDLPGEIIRTSFTTK